jgi:hypothetical protein
MSRSRSRIRVVLALLWLGDLAQAPAAFARPDEDVVQLTQRVQIEKGHGRPARLAVDFPDTWSEETSIYVNSRKLVDVPRGKQGEQRPTARIKVMAQQRLDHVDALRQIHEFALGVGADPKDFLTIAGWPALQVGYDDIRPQPDRRPNFYEDPKVHRVATLVAAGDVLVRIDATLPAGPSRRLLNEARAIARSLTLEASGKAKDSDAELDSMRSALESARSAAGAGQQRFFDQMRESAPPAEATPLAETVAPGYNQRVFFNGYGEIEIAVSPDGQNVVIGKNVGVWVGSNDGGETFPNTGTVPFFNCGDPSMGWGQSGAFYYAGIHCGCTPVQYPAATFPGTGPFGWACNSVARSTDNGVSFPVTARPMVMCEVSDPAGVGPNPAGFCFPDQEHIAVDRVNPGSGGGTNDQIYSTWRNFDATDQDSAIVCSQDSGANWTAPLDLGGSSSFPRIGAGSDGSVYVVDYIAGWYRLSKFSSCANGLNLITTVNIVAPPTGPCPFAGHDRCDQNPRSQTIVVDDQNPNHLYFAYAANTAPNNENILVHHSVDAGATWTAPVQANTALPGKRIMPWLCSTGGNAYVTWFDRRNAPVCATPPCPGINNDRTDFFGAQLSVNQGGSLQADGDFIISEGPDTWCSSGWPCGGPRDPTYSESCSVQPQLAGTCIDTQGTAGSGDDVATGQRCDFSNCQGGNVDIVYPDADCECTAGDGTNIQCQTGGGCPKYGDYNGNACAAGRLYAGWPSLSSPPGVPAPTTQIGLLFDSVLVDEVPHLQIPGDVDFGGSCGGGAIEGTLEICNTGTATLEIQPITSDDAQFAVTRPSGGYPVRISPDFCFPFEVTFNADTASNGVQTATLTIRSNDPTNPVETIDVSASADESEADIRTTLVNTLSFDNVCIREERTLDVTIQNSGGCPLSISSITSSDPNFQVGAVSAFPLVVGAGDSVQVPIEFQPVNNTTTGVKSANLTIASNDPDTPSLVLPLLGNVPMAVAETFIADSGSFSNVCADTIKDLELTIQNNGACPLSVTAVALSGANPGDFSLPNGFAPLVLESLNSVVMPVRFQPTEFTTASPRTASVDVTNRTAFSLDATSVDSTPVSGTVPPPDINVPANTGADPEVEFGNVCAGAVAEKEIPVCNTGLCTLNVTGASLGACDDFTIVQNPFPSEVSHDFCMSVVVRYTPTEEGSHSCTLTITSDDPDENPIEITLHGTTPATIIDIPGDLHFSPEVVQTIDACSTLKPYPISNNGICPLTITDVSIDPAGENSGDYGLDGLPSFPIILQTGHIAGEGDLDVVFAPQEPLDRDKLGILSVTYVSDSVTGATTTVDSNLCGEAVLTGARVLVTYGGSPVDVVERIQIQRITANRNRRPQLDTVSVLQNVPLQEYLPSGDPEYSACRGFRYHSEYGTVANPLQLLPGVYQVNATIRVNGRRYTKSVGFSVNACDFNPTVVVTF